MGFAPDGAQHPDVGDLPSGTGHRHPLLGGKLSRLGQGLAGAEGVARPKEAVQVPLAQVDVAGAHPGGDELGPHSGQVGEHRVANILYLHRHYRPWI